MLTASGDYVILKKLGAGAFGDVFLVEAKDGVKYAIKSLKKRMIYQKRIQKYLREEIKIMESLDSPYFIKFYKQFEQQQTFNLVLEYCDGGDLLSYQYQSKNQVFTLEQARIILVDIILGLEELHKAGYAHRDIKQENILIKNQNGKRVYKLGDFGLSKKADICETFLGTRSFMSPEIYQKTYGREIDVWAFGVLFYSMLNKDVPFYILQNGSDKQIKHFLLKQAQNFSYKRFVLKLKKRFLQNCTPEIEDLFKRIFDINPRTRITFSQIREHPVFANFFSKTQKSTSDQIKKQEVKNQSEQVYHKPLLQKIFPQNVKKTPNKPKIQSQSEQTVQFSSKQNPQKILFKQPLIDQINSKKKFFENQKRLLTHQKNKISFLREIINRIDHSGVVFSKCQKSILAYFLLKYYVILLRNFKANLNKQHLQAKYPNFDWQDYLKAEDFKQFLQIVSQNLKLSQTYFFYSHKSCKQKLPQIQLINKKFPQFLSLQIAEQGFDGQFKKSYIQSISQVYRIFKCRCQEYFQDQTYFQLLIRVCLVFNRIYESDQYVSNIFKDYLTQMKIKPNQINFIHINGWLIGLDSRKLQRIAAKIK